MAWPTLTDVKTYAGVVGTADDGLLAFLNAGAKAYIEKYTDRLFIAASSAKSFPVAYPYVPSGNRWFFPYEDFIAATTVVNGNGVTVVAGDRITHGPDTPYHAIELEAGSGLTWLSTADGLIVATFTWGYSADVPSDIFLAALELAGYRYRARAAGAGGDVAQAGRAAGLTVQPGDVPPSIMAVLDAYRRVSA